MLRLASLCILSNEVFSGKVLRHSFKTLADAESSFCFNCGLSDCIIIIIIIIIIIKNVSKSQSLKKIQCAAQSFAHSFVKLSVV